MADYINNKQLIEYRKNNKSIKCAILDVADYKPVVDHDHATGRIRGVISSEGNVLIGKIENCFKSRCVDCELSLPEVLRKVALYLEGQQGPYHPVGVRQLVRRFRRMPKDEQIRVLSNAYSLEEIELCDNSVDRSKLYRRILVGE